VLVAAAACPHPPLLVPEVTGSRPSGEAMDAVRAACDRAVAVLRAAQPDLLVAVGSGDATAVYGGSAAGSLREYGVSFAVGTGEPVLPLSLTVGSWLLRRGCAALPGSRVLFQAVARDSSPAACLRLGAGLAQRAPRVAMLAMGDGSARKAVSGPGAADPAADSYDADVAAALAAADGDRLARLSRWLDDELMASGRAAWQVLAGAARGREYRGRLLCSARPYVVSYLVASWESCP
jgi:hypothetical protein